MIPALPISLELRLRRAIEQRQRSDAGPERWAQLDDAQARTFAALLATHTAAQWSQVTGTTLDPARLVLTRPAVAGAIREALTAAAAGDTTPPALVARNVAMAARSELSAAAATSLGVSRFRWRTRRDDRVRPTHAALEGQVFDVGAGAPGVGLPGREYGCRCSMEPV